MIQVKNMFNNMNGQKKRIIIVEIGFVVAFLISYIRFLIVFPGYAVHGADQEELFFSLGKNLVISHAISLAGCISFIIMNRGIVKRILGGVCSIVSLIMMSEMLEASVIDNTVIILMTISGITMILCFCLTIPNKRLNRTASFDIRDLALKFHTAPCSRDEWLSIVLIYLSAYYVTGNLAQTIGANSAATIVIHLVLTAVFGLAHNYVIKIVGDGYDEWKYVLRSLDNIRDLDLKDRIIAFLLIGWKSFKVLPFTICTCFFIVVLPTTTKPIASEIIVDVLQKPVRDVRVLHAAITLFLAYLIGLTLGLIIKIIRGCYIYNRRTEKPRKSREYKMIWNPCRAYLDKKINEEKMNKEEVKPYYEKYYKNQQFFTDLRCRIDSVYAGNVFHEKNGYPSLNYRAEVGVIEILDNARQEYLRTFGQPFPQETYNFYINELCERKTDFQKCGEIDETYTYSGLWVLPSCETIWKDYWKMREEIRESKEFREEYRNRKRKQKSRKT